MSDPVSPPLRRILLVQPEGAEPPDPAPLLHDAVPGAEPARRATAASALEALEEGEIDVVLVDGRRDEPEALELLRRLRPDEGVPVVLLTGTPDPDAGTRAIRAGASDALPLEGLTPERLGRVLRHAVERSRFLASLPERGRAAARREVAERRARERLESSAASYRALFDSLPEPVFLVSAEGAVVFANAAAGRVTGFRADELCDRSFASLAAEEEGADAAASALREARGRTVHLHEWWIRRSGAAPLPLELSLSPGAYYGEPGVIAMGRDVRARRAAEEALQQSERRFRSLVENAPDAVMVLRPDGTIVYNTPALERMLGYAPEALLGRNGFALVHPEDVGWVLERFGRVAAVPGASDEAEYRVRRSDGSWLLLRSIAQNRLDDPAVEGVVVNSRDVTELRREQEELRRSEERVRAFFERSSEGICCVDLDPPVDPALSAARRAEALFAGWVVDCNDAFAAMNAGRPPHELIGLPLSVLLPPEDPDSRALVRDFVERGFRVADREVRRPDGEGVPRVFSLALTGVFEGAALRRLWIVQRDATEAHRLAAQLRQAQKMEAVGRLAGGIAHDFNNLLTVIKGNVDLLLLDLPDDSPAREELGEIRDAGERAASLTRQLLAFSRRQVMQLATLDLNDVVRELDRMLRRLIGEDVTLALDLASSPCRVRADRGQVEQVLLNLVVNARDAMPRGGTLTLATRCRTVDAGEARRRPYRMEPGGYVLLSVSDTGTGMSEEVRGQVFEPFFTTKPAGRGTGLGLATVYGIVKQSGGFVEVESEEGRGSTFTVELPQAEPEPEEGEEEPAGGGEEETPASAGRILLVEDEAAVRGLARRLLERAGYEVLAAADADAALALCAEAGARVDLLLTDVVLPGMSGPELAGAVRARDPGVRVLYVSGYTDEMLAPHGVLEAGVELLEKPFAPEALVRRVAALLRGAGEPPSPA